MRTADIRSAYLDFFRDRGHRVVPSGPLVPNDPTLLFTVAGMVQFKEALIGLETLDYSRATSAQRCMRAGGKHNDLENVGYTARHHTFFEMLGNFSFGDYFKEESIAWAWEFLVDVLGIDTSRLWFTVHPTDQEARDIWVKKIGIATDRVIDHPDNFWTMGETGPCGPDSEIFFDQGPSIAGGPPGSADEDGDRFLEFWNLVFPQFDRSADGELAPLAKPGVDTGLGLERLAALTQGVPSNYEIDVFRPIFREAATLAGNRPIEQALQEPSMRVIADHIRSTAFLIADGVLPSREGRGYVLRRIIRRAIRHGHKLGIDEPFFYKLVDPLIVAMEDTAEHVNAVKERVERVLRSEEEGFRDTLRKGLELLETELESSPGDVLAGDLAFKLYDTYGFPVDLTADVARERDVKLDMERFEELMAQQRERARAAGKFDSNLITGIQVASEVEFEGYEKIHSDCQLTELFRTTDGSTESVDDLSTGQNGMVVLDKSGFYGEAGGQVGDTGEIITSSGRFEVYDTTRVGDQFLHHGKAIDGTLVKGQEGLYRIDALRRQDIARNHSATHLLHAALRTVLGDHVQQRGSLVAPDRLRFDFSHDQPVTSAEQRTIEKLVNEHIAHNSSVFTDVLSYDDAIAKGAMGLFGEKYGDEVRVLSMGDGFSLELCGGTHVARTGEIGQLRIVSESSIAAGVRRLECVTGRVALERVAQLEESVAAASAHLSTNRENLVERIDQLLAERDLLREEVAQAKAGNARDAGAALLQHVVEIKGIRVIGACIEGDSDTMMQTFDELRGRLGTSVIALGIVQDEKVQLVCGVSKDITKSLKAGDLVKFLNPLVGTRGGGRPEMARAGGGDIPDALAEALGSVPNWVKEQLAASN